MSSLYHVGRLLGIIGWSTVVFAMIFLYAIPFIEAKPDRITIEFVSRWIEQNFFTAPSIVRLLMVFVPLGILIWSGKYLVRLSRDREVRREEQVMGLLKAYGRISLVDVSNRLGISVMETERYLASIRGKRDVVFSISDGVVIMPGFERSRPVKEVEKITREVLTIPCRYCGALIPMGSTVCPECGAGLKVQA